MRRALDTRSFFVLIGRKAAIKVLLPELSSKPEIIKRFFNEAKATAAIGHPGIVEILDYGHDDDGRAFLVMEFLEGDTLRARMKSVGPMSLPHVLDLMEHVISALGAAHSKGIVHRDLKPSNIMLVRDPGVRFRERPKILDFGIAKLANAGKDGGFQTRTGVMMGTPSYMAPEQCRGAGDVDHRADFYALGCIFFELTCGRPPFIGEGAGEIIGMHQFLEPPAPSSFAPALPPAVERLILRMLGKRPEGRPGSADEILRELFAVAAATHAGDLALLRAVSSTAPPEVVSGVPRRGSLDGDDPPSTGDVLGVPTPVAPSSPTPIPGAATTLGAAALGVPATSMRRGRRWIAITATAVCVCAGVAGGLTVIDSLGVSGSLGSMSNPSTMPASLSASQDMERSVREQAEAASREQTDAALDDPEDSPERITLDGPVGRDISSVEPRSRETSRELVESTPTPGMTEQSGIEPPGARPSSIKVQVQSRPPGAKIYAVSSGKRRRVLGKTPWQQRVPSSEDKLEFILEKPGYQQRVIELAGDRSEEISVDLEKSVREERRERRSRRKRSRTDVAKQRSSQGRESGTGTEPGSSVKAPVEKGVIVDPF